MNSSKNYYALLVGINNYPDPFSTLGGCIKDIDNIEAYLKDWIKEQHKNPQESTSEFIPGINIQHIGPLHILRLADAQATHANVTQAFREFLSQAKKTQGPDGQIVEDIVWFHFSGHGSEEYTAEEFLELEPSGKDQTLVCYNESYGSGLTNLADKEIAALLHHVASKDPQGNPTESPHIIVSLDCCHSGSGTRFSDFESQLKTRNADVLPAPTRSLAEKKGTKFRSLDSYAKGFYSGQKSLHVPVAPHVLLSACESVQLAGDFTEGGVFTQGLMHALKKVKSNINYSDLYMQTRTSVQKIREKDQTPTFEVIGEFNAYRRFLDGSPLGAPDDYPLAYEAGTWKISCGAIHGIPLKSDKPVLMDVLQDEKLVGKAELTAIGAQKSHFKPIGNWVLDKNKFYKAHIHFLPIPPVLVYLHGESKEIDFLKKYWDERKGIKWIDQAQDSKDAQLEVAATPTEFQITDRLKNKRVFSWKNGEEGAKIIVDSLAKMVNWERVLKLNHDKSQILSEDWINFEMKIVGKDPSKPLAFLKETQNQLLADKTTFLGDGKMMGVGLHPIWKVNAANCKQNLYAYMFHLRTDYSIASYEGEKVFRPKEHSGKEEVVFPMWSEGKGWGIGAKDQEAESYFKLIVTTEPLDYQQLTQSSLAGDRLIDFSSKPMKVEDDWCSITMKVSMSRK